MNFNFVHLHLLMNNREEVEMDPSAADGMASSLVEKVNSITHAFSLEYFISILKTPKRQTKGIQSITYNPIQYV